jgi:PAS domain S-box-containing protein
LNTVFLIVFYSPAREPYRDTIWIFAIYASTLIAFILVAIGLYFGYTTFISHILYIPIILVSLRYTKRGIFFSLAVAGMYFMMVLLLTTPDMLETIVSAGRAGMMTLVGTVLTYLSNRLKTQEALYRAVVEDQSEFIARFLPDGTHIFANEAYCRYYGKKGADIIGSKFAPPLPPHEGVQIRRHLLSLTPEHPSGSIDHRVLNPDGEIRWQAWNDRGIFDEEGNLIEYQSVGRDITERKNSEEALRFSEDLYRTIFNTTGTAIMIVEHDGTVLMANREFKDLYGYSFEEIEGKKFWKTIIADEDKGRLIHYHNLRRESQGSAPRTYEVKILDKTGRNHEAILTVEMIPGTKQSVISMMDVTQRNQGDRLLHTINRINKLIVHEHDPGELLKRGCVEFRNLADDFVVGIGLMENGNPVHAAISHQEFASAHEAYLRGEVVQEVLSGRIPTGIHPLHTPGQEGCLGPTHALTIPMVWDYEVKGAFIAYIPATFNLTHREIQALHTLANDLMFAIRSREIENEKMMALMQIEHNMAQLATLNDHIRNPLQAISSLAELDGGACAEEIHSQIREINTIITQLDNGWIESEKIRAFLRKHYSIEQSETLPLSGYVQEK